MKVLQNLEPKAVFEYFEEISNIPRGSGNEKEISDYLLNFGKSLGLESIQDNLEHGSTEDDLVYESCWARIRVDVAKLKKLL